jgi:hypothetical protein
MDEHHQHDNGGQGSAHIYGSAPQSDARSGEDLREDDRDQGVSTFEAHAEERGKNGETLAVDGEAPRQDRDQGRVGAFDVNPEAVGRKIQALDDVGRVAAAGFAVYAWQRQVADFYGMRLRKNVEFGRRLSEADGIADVIGAQGEYVRATLLDYVSSFRSLYGFGLHGPQQTAERLDR